MVMAKVLESASVVQRWQWHLVDFEFSGYVRIQVGIFHFHILSDTAY